MTVAEKADNQPSRNCPKSHLEDISVAGRNPSENNSRKTCVPTNVSTRKQLEGLPIEYLSDDPLRPLRIIQAPHDEENGAKSGKELKFALTPLTYSVIFILLIELLERFSFYGLNYTFTTYLTGVYDPTWNAAFTAVRAGTYVSTGVAIAYSTPFIGAVLADGYIGDYWVIVLGTAICYIPGLILIALTTVPNLLGSTFNVAALSAGYLGLFPTGAGMIKSVVNIFGAKQFHPVLQSSLIETYYVNFYLSINIGALVGGVLVPVVAQHNVSAAYFIPPIALTLGLLCFLAGTTRYLRVHPTKENRFITMDSCRNVVAGIKTSLKVLPSKLCSLTRRSPRVKNEEDSPSASDEPPSSPSRLHAIVNVVIVSALVTPFNIVYNQMSTTFIEQGTVMKEAWGFVDAPTMNNFDSISVIFFGIIVGNLLYPALARRNIHFPTASKFALGSFLSVLSISWTLFVNHRITSTFENSGEQITVLWQILSYAFIGAGEIFAISTAYEAAFVLSPPDRKTLGSAINLFFIGAIPNFICIGLFQACAPWFDNADGVADITTTQQYTEAHVYKYLWVLWGIALFGTFLNLLPPVRKWLQTVQDQNANAVVSCEMTAVHSRE